YRASGARQNTPHRRITSSGNATGESRGNPAASPGDGMIVGRPPGRSNSPPRPQARGGKSLFPRPHPAGIVMNDKTRRGAARLARQAHNLEVVGSNPTAAT